MSFPMPNRLLAISLALVLGSGSALAGVRGNAYDVQVNVTSGPSLNTFTFSAGGSFTSIGELGQYGTNGSFSELDLFVIGFWTAAVDNNFVGGGGPDMSMAGIHLFGVFVLGGGSVNGNQVTFFGGPDDGLPPPPTCGWTQPVDSPAAFDPQRGSTARETLARGVLLDDRRGPQERRRRRTASRWA